MTARFSSLSTRALFGVAAAVVLVYTAAVWMLLVSPKRSDAESARAELETAQLALVEARVAAARPRTNAAPVADVFRLAKAMPSVADQPGLVLEISRLAKRSGVMLRSLTPQEPVAGLGGPTLIPVTVSVSGSYAQIARFLERTRTLVTVRDGTIHASGRLLSVTSVGLGESETDGFPQLDATIELDSYVYDGPIVPAELPEAEPSEEEAATGSTALGGMR